jgi:hypothetical protein
MQVSEQKQRTVRRMIVLSSQLKINNPQKKGSFMYPFLLRELLVTKQCGSLSWEEIHPTLIERKNIE